MYNNREIVNKLCKRVMRQLNGFEEYIMVWKNADKKMEDKRVGE